MDCKRHGFVKKLREYHNFGIKFEKTYISKKNPLHKDSNISVFYNLYVYHDSNKGWAIVWLNKWILCTQMHGLHNETMRFFFYMVLDYKSQEFKKTILG